MKKYKPGDLFISNIPLKEIKFCKVDNGLIRNDIDYFDCVTVSEKDHLLFTQHHFLTENTVMTPIVIKNINVEYSIKLVRFSPRLHPGANAASVVVPIIAMAAAATLNSSTKKRNDFKTHELTQLFNQACDEWLDKKKILGGIFLTPNGKNIWLSHYMTNYLELVS